ncbi:MAG: hypothetical protein LC772_02655 [Chloroflexi bacterium]|nr:hypothetical protein [Chloroflexota bacterium]
MSIPFDQLRGDRECAGIGGITHLYEEGAVLVFSEPGVALYAYDLPVDIMPDDPEMTAMPSLLGRDILNRWRITYDPTGVGLKINVRTADRIFDLRRQ